MGSAQKPDVYNHKTDKELAWKIGISPAIFSAWRNGKCKVDYELIFNTCSDLRSGWIVDGTGGKYDVPTVPEEERLTAIKQEYSSMLGRIKRLRAGADQLIRDIESSVGAFYDYPGDGYLIKSYNAEGMKYQKVEKSTDDFGAE